MHGNHKGGVKRILNSAISTADHCYQRVTFKLCIWFETAIVSNHMLCYFKIFKLHLNIFPISEPTVTEPTTILYLNRGLFASEQALSQLELLVQNDSVSSSSQCTMIAQRGCHGKTVLFMRAVHACSVSMSNEKCNRRDVGKSTQHFWFNHTKSSLEKKQDYTPGTWE